jgi:hypothetical protein
MELMSAMAAARFDCDWENVTTAIKPKMIRRCIHMVTYQYKYKINARGD